MDSDSEFELIDLGDAKEETKGHFTMLPREENPQYPFGVLPPGEACVLGLGRTQATALTSAAAAGVADRASDGTPAGVRRTTTLHQFEECKWTAKPNLI